VTEDEAKKRRELIMTSKNKYEEETIGPPVHEDD